MDYPHRVFTASREPRSNSHNATCSLKATCESICRSMWFEGPAGTWSMCIKSARKINPPPKMNIQANEINKQPLGKFASEMSILSVPFKVHLKFICANTLTHFSHWIVADGSYDLDSFIKKRITIYSLLLCHQHCLCLIMRHTSQVWQIKLTGVLWNVTAAQSSGLMSIF